MARKANNPIVMSLPDVQEVLAEFIRLIELYPHLIDPHAPGPECEPEEVLRWVRSNIQCRERHHDFNFELWQAEYLRNRA